MEVWSLIADAVRGIHPQDLEAFGVGRANRLNPKTRAQEWPVVERVMRVLGVSGVDVYVAPDPDLMVAVASDPLALVVGESAKGKAGPEVRFRLGRACALLRDRTVLVSSLPAKELGVLFAAAAEIAGAPASNESPGGSPEVVAERARHLGKLLGRSERKGLMFLRNQIEAGIGSPADFARGVRMTALRAGLLVSGDIRAVLGVLRREAGKEPFGRETTADERLAQFEKTPEEIDVLMFAASGDHLALRSELGLRVSERA